MAGYAVSAEGWWQQPPCLSRSLWWSSPRCATEPIMPKGRAERGWRTNTNLCLYRLLHGRNYPHMGGHERTYPTAHLNLPTLRVHAPTSDLHCQPRLPLYSLLHLGSLARDIGDTSFQAGPAKLLNQSFESAQGPVEVLNDPWICGDVRVGIY